MWKLTQMINLTYLMSAAKFGPTPKLIPRESELIELNPSSAKYLRHMGHVPC